MVLRENAEKDEARGRIPEAGYQGGSSPFKNALAENEMLPPDRYADATDLRSIDLPFESSPML